MLDIISLARTSERNHSWPIHLYILILLSSFLHPPNSESESDEYIIQSFNVTFVEMRVHMDCAGCETKIKKALQKLDDVDDIDIDIAMQKVTVMGRTDQKKVLRTVRKTGRRAELWPYPYNPEYQNFHQQQYYYQQLQQKSQQPMAAYYTFQPPASSYNYEKHGYSGDFGYYQQSPYSHVLDERTSAFFSDENPHACSIM